jgi:hypothetical protein
VPRPGRKPTDPRNLDVRLKFASEDDGQRVRDFGGGPWIKSLVLAALHRGKPITTTLKHGADTIEMHTSIPIEQLSRTPPCTPAPETPAE